MDRAVTIVWPSSKVKYTKSPDHRVSAKRIWPYEIPKYSPLNADLEAVKAKRRIRRAANKTLRPIEKKLGKFK